MTITQSRNDAGLGGRLGLRVGDQVRLRPLEEIEATLDADGCTDRLPFMAEMVALQGRTITVDSRADKTCDTVNLAGTTRAMDDTVHLQNIRCDGSAHGGCQAYCLFYFREQWLERVPDGEPATPAVAEAAAAAVPAELAEKLDRFAHPSEGHYRCQATQALEASRPLRPGRHYWADLRTRNVPVGRVVRLLFWAIVNLYQKFSRHFVPGPLRIRDGAPLPYLRGAVQGDAWPEEPHLELQPGELVEVRGREEIRTTLDRHQRNRGLWFDHEMLSLCGTRGRILYRVERLIDEKTGRMLRIKKDLYLVSGMVGCEGIFHKLCTRGVMAMMRDVWLRRVE